VLPIDAERHGIDVVIAVGYKWLMSPHGISVFYVAPLAMERIRPTAPGRYSVQGWWHRPITRSIGSPTRAVIKRSLELDGCLRARGIDGLLMRSDYLRSRRPPAALPIGD